jgi:hypothetical protein
MDIFGSWRYFNPHRLVMAIGGYKHKDIFLKG